MLSRIQWDERADIDRRHWKLRGIEWAGKRLSFCLFPNFPFRRFHSSRLLFVANILTRLLGLGYSHAELHHEMKPMRQDVEEWSFLIFFCCVLFKFISSFLYHVMYAGTVSFNNLSTENIEVSQKQLTFICSICIRILNLYNAVFSIYIFFAWWL